jgi:aminomethyltransferase
MGGEGVTVIAGDGLVGEEGYEVVCAADAANRVFETLLSFGMNAVPFGYRTWGTLTAEAGTPLFDTELDDRIPNVLGLRNALDFEKGCYVGQEVVSKVENRGRPSQRLVGLRLEGGGASQLPDSGAAVTVGGDRIGEVTRAVESPSLEEPIALALVEFDADSESVSVERDADSDDGGVGAVRTPLPFVDGSAVSERLPVYPEA